MAVLLACGMGMAQLDTATILGTVLDSSGAVIPGAKVVVENMGTSATVELTTDPSGNFIAPVLPIGKYKVTVSMTGFNTYVQEGIQLNVSDRIKLNIELKPGAVTQHVTVVGEGPVVETASTTLGAVVSAQQAVDLPLNGRAIDQLLMLAPGVVSVGGPVGNAGAFNSVTNGMSAARGDAGQKWLLDGGDSSQIDSDLSSGGYGSTARVNRISVDAVAEFRVVDSMYSAEYGQTLGAVVNFISKSGTNQFHGSLFEFFRNDKLDARNYFNPAPLYKPERRLNQYGGSIGGPIIKDKLFFFTDYEAVRERTGISYSVYVPTEAFRDSLASVLHPVVAQLPLPNGPVSTAEPRLALYNNSYSNVDTEDTGMMKIDYLPTSKDRVTVRYNGNGSFTKTYFGVGDGQWRPIPAMLTTSKISYTRTLTPTMLNEAGFFLNRGNWSDAAAGIDAIRNIPVVYMGSGAAGAGPSLEDMDVANNLFTYNDTLSWIKGKHQIKIGAQVARMQCNKEVNFQQEAYFPTLDWFQANMPYLDLTIGWPRPGLRITQQGYFVQDDIQATHNLTINAGLRYQYDGSPTEAFGRIANFDMRTGTLDAPGTTVFDAPKLNFAPRIGLAYTPFASKKTVIRAGYGIFYADFSAAGGQMLPTNVPGFAQNREVSIFQDPTLVGFPFPDISAYTATPVLSLWAFNKHWQEIYTEQWNLNIQQGLGESTVLQVGYVGNWGRHITAQLVPAIDGNPFIPGTGVRRLPNVGPVAYADPGASSKFNSLQVGLKRRMSHGFAFDINYTWSHNQDQGALSWAISNGGAAPAPQNPDNFAAEWASADYDVRHNVTFDYTYQLPAAPHSPKWLGSGWQINGITNLRTGLPINVICSCDPMMIGDASGRPNLVPGQPFRPANYTVPTNQINYTAFAWPADPAGLVPKPFGNAGRNLFSGPGFMNWDFSLFKRFKLRERQTLEFRYEMFNMFNHPNFSNPASDISAPSTFGQSFAAYPARQMQFALKYVF
jgi:hypothetical protein